MSDELVERDELKERLTNARAELESIEQRRAARAAEEAKRNRVEAVEREIENAKAIADAEETLGIGKFATVNTPLGVVIVKRPQHMHYRKFIGLKEIGPDDAEKLARSCLVYPSRAAFERIGEEYPAIPMLVAGAVLDLAAGKQAELAAKP
jgi:hypothetical protein